ncbi:RIO2 Serine/threonine-protein kinase RIO2 [Candida maltosa Xu316]|uniref:Serine/threonine-protein kinase RIO2 n=1 Tax=Candida maltosa (strain Xu316) TaxID=1245528 RepID=M3HL82_CANMX|nr:Serine/threonine-protein kinase, putative [Candida maltosa Xu316]
MKLDTSHMRYLTSDDFRVLQAIELGSRNHELVPTQMIHSIGGLKSPSATNRAIGDIAKLKLISRLRNAKYDGFRLTYNGYDYLALKTMLNRDTLYSVGTVIGVGKESDIYSVSDPQGTQKVLKIHRLGRTSFKTVKNNRDYLKNKQTSNWMYLSRLAAEKEYQFMDVLYTNGFNVPQPFDHSRHCVMMEWIKGIPMKHLKQHKNYKKLYSDLMNFIVRLAKAGLIHCDFNEFNIIIRDDPTGHEYDFVVIDFPQCVSIEHVDAKVYFDRDVQGIRDFFSKKFRYNPQHDPTMFDTDGYGDGYKYAYPNFKRDVVREKSLDVEVQASGYAKKKTGNREDKDLEKAVLGMRIKTEEDEDLSEIDDEEEEDDDEEDDSEEEYDDDDDEEEEDLVEESENDEENEKIIAALSLGDKKLKMDKLGNYILDE